MFITHSLLKILDYIHIFILLGKGQVFSLHVRLWTRGYSSTFPWTLHQKGVSGQRHTPAVF